MIAVLIFLVVFALPGIPAASVELGPPEVMKLSWNSRALCPGDLNGDGRLDLILIDNDRLWIDVLYQGQAEPQDRREPKLTPKGWQPILDDAPFRLESIPIGLRAFDIGIGDFDGNGLPDLAYTARPDGLVIRYQDRKANFNRSRSWELDAPSTWVGTLEVGDLDGDGRDDIVVLTKGSLKVFLQTGEGAIDEHTTIPLGEGDRYGLRILDADRDGIPDLIYQLDKSEQSLRLIPGNGGGDFGAEYALALPSRRGVIQPLDKTLMAGIANTTGAVEVLSLSRTTGKKLHFGNIQPRIIATRQSGDSGKSLETTGDFNGDSRTDLAVSGSASIALLLQDEEGRLIRTPDYPALSDIRGMRASDLDGDGRDELIMVSPSEKALAWTRIDTGGRLLYPTPLPVGDAKPMLLAVGDLDSDGSPEILTAIEESAKWSVLVLRKEQTQWTSEKISLEKLHTPPRGLEIVDADQDGRSDILVMLAHKPARIILNRGEAGFEEAGRQTGFQKSLLDDLKPAALSLCDIDRDRKKEMLVASRTFVRAIRLNSEGMIEVVDQINAPSSGKKPDAALCWNWDSHSERDLAWISDGGERVDRMHQGRKGVYRPLDHLEGIPLKFQRAQVIEGKFGKGEDLLLFGKDRMVMLGSSGLRWEMTTDPVFEPDPLEEGLDMLITGDLDDDGRAEIIAIDAQDTHILEILKAGGGRWESVLHFPLFESDPHYKGQQGGGWEPRDGLIADFTGDGREDLVLLIHDRLLLYPQLESGKRARESRTISK